ncbi:S8 family serine peptidase [Paenibacillus macerans]|uniref:S8 family serine peptidase n=1 Tax=Paenibacillus macerans TaxID=44252 RepID=UPI002559F8A1|nr:S8 family serine peptidase [Paenibacillus macerans]
MISRIRFRTWLICLLALGLIATGAFPGTTTASGSEPSPLISQVLNSETEPASEPVISPQIDTSSKEPVRIIVQLDGQPAAAGKFAAKAGMRSLAAVTTEATVNNEQQKFLHTAAGQGLDLDVNYQYDTVLNGFEITIPANQIPKLADVPGVKSIHENSIWYPVPLETASMDDGAPFEINPIKQIGADLAWEKGLTGKGLKVGVIDTGVDYKHPDLAGAYKGGYDSFYNDDDPYEEPPIAQEDDPLGTGYEGTSHGTHVAGTIVGRAANTESDIVQKGIAYEAELYAYKVLGRNQENPAQTNGSSAQVIDGIERAVKDGMDVINLSLGSDSEKDVNSPDAVAINNAVLSGVVAVVANGNAGPGNYSMGSPATAQLAIAVGGVDTDSLHYSGSLDSKFANSSDLSDATSSSATSATYATYDFNVMAWETLQDDFRNILGTKPLEVVYANLGSDEDYAGLDVKGKVVLVSRGAQPFAYKIANAKERGAVAIAIFNGMADASGKNAELSDAIPDEYDGYINLPQGDSFDYIPTLDLRRQDGLALARALTENDRLALNFTFPEEYPSEIVPGDSLYAYSSWGPNADKDLSIKPDIVAPAVNIRSSYPAYGNLVEGASYDRAYMRSSGTSMAAPHVAGLALLLLQQHPDWTPFDVRSALANTADVLDNGAGGLYEVYQQGAGRANVANAVETPALLQAVEPITILDPNYNRKNVINYNSSASLGVVAPGSSQTDVLQLKNTSDQEVSYEASVVWHGGHHGVEAALDLTALTAAASETATFQLTLTAAPDAASGFYEGQVNLTNPGLPELHLPFVVYVDKQPPANGFGIQEAKVTNSIVYPNRSTQKSTDLSFKVTATDTNFLQIRVYNVNDEMLGLIGDQVTEDINDRFAPGVYTFEGIGSAYYPVDANGNLILDGQGQPVTRYLEDGIYKIWIYALQLDSNYQIAVRKDGSAIMYNSVTSFRVDNSKGNGGGSGGSGGGGGGGDRDKGSSSVSNPPAPAEPSGSLSAAAKAVIASGHKQVTLTAKTTAHGGVTTATVGDSELSAALASAGSGSPAAIVLSLPGTTVTNAKASFPAGQVKQLAALHPQSVIVFSAAGSALSLPVSLLAQAPASAGLDLIIELSESGTAAFTEHAPGATVLGTPVLFAANWVAESGSTPLKVPAGTFIKRAFTVPGQIEPGTAGVLYDENDEVRPVASVFTAREDKTTLVTVNRPGFSVYAAVTRTIQFADLAGSPAADHIQALASKFIIEGTSTGKFSPNGNLTRAEFTSLLVRALGLKAQGTAAKFGDVKATDWFAEDIAAANEAGIIHGKSQSVFAPGASVTRQEMAAILARALAFTGAELPQGDSPAAAYADAAEIAAYAKDSVQALTAAGVIGGVEADGGTNFRPNATATRETAASALYLLLNKAGLSD